MNAQRQFFFATFGLVLFFGTTAVGQDDAAAARAILDEIGKTIRSAESFHLKAQVDYTANYGDSEEAMGTAYEISVHRDGDIAVRVKNESLDSLLLLTGDQFIQYMPEFQQYTLRERDESAVDLLELASFDIVDPVVDVFQALAQFKSPTEGYVVRDLALLQAESIGGETYDRVRFTLNGVQYDLWVDDGPERLIRRIEPDMTPLESEYQRQYQLEFDISVVANITEFDLDADVSDKLAFSPPEGTEKVERFGPKSEAEKMAGSPAPDFTLPLLDGGEFTLSKARGDVIILDFWATWCGPCRVAMPVLEEVAKEYADQGVKLISVDLQEEPADIQAFLDSMDLDVTVALDSDGAVAGLYRVEGIPQSVIVDRDGTIHTVHVGLWAMPPMTGEETQEQQAEKMHTALADSLREELDAILSESPAD